MIETTQYGDSTVYLKFIPAKEYQLMENVTATSVHCFPLSENQEDILFTINPRGIDIIGGHVEPGETAEEALIREAMEEASIDVRSFRLIGAIEVDNRDNPQAILKGYPEKGYQLFYAVDNYSLLPFQATHECTDRKFVPISDISTQHHKWLKTHQTVLEYLSQLPSAIPTFKAYKP